MAVGITIAYFTNVSKLAPLFGGLKQLPRWWRIVIPAATPPVISSECSNFLLYTGVGQSLRPNLA